MQTVLMMYELILTSTLRITRPVQNLIRDFAKTSFYSLL